MSQLVSKRPLQGEASASPRRVHVLVADMASALTWLRDEKTRGLPPNFLSLVDACTCVQDQLDRTGEVRDLPWGYAALQEADAPHRLNMGAFHTLFGNLLIERELKTRRAVAALMSAQ